MSYRLTFSLASLIFLIALGLVFAPTSVMAHDDASPATDTPREHPHPLASGLDSQTDADGTTPGSAVTAHYGHPTISSVMLKMVTDKTRGNMAVITADDTNTADVNEHGLTLVVTFSEKVNTTDGSSLVVTPTDLIESGDLIIQVRNANSAIVDSPATVSGAAGDITRQGNGGTTFEVPVIFNTASIPNGTKDDPLEYLTFYVRVGPGAVFGLAQPAGIDPNIPGGGNYPSTVSEFKLVSELPAALKVPGAPTGVMRTVSDDKSSITVSWTAPTDMGNPNLTGYKVTKSYMAADGAAMVEKMTDAATTMATFGSADEPLARDTAFTFSVVAVNSEGDSPAGMSAPVTIASPPPAPFFPAGLTIPPIKIWAMNAYTPKGDDRIILPKARAAEGVNYLYKVRKKGGDAGDPQELPGGFELLNDDLENRTLEVREANKAASVAMAKTMYEYIAYNTADMMSESDPIEFTIEVVARTVPTAPTMVMAAEEGLTEKPLERQINTNRVVVNWLKPMNAMDYLATFSAPHDKIHFGSPVTHYEVIQTGKITSGNPTGTPDAMYPDDDPNTMKIDGKHTMKLTGDDTSYITPELASQSMSSNRLGVYEYQVRAVNGVGTGPSNKVEDDSTALVLNPPNQPGDLRDAKEGTVDGSVILNWLPVTNEGDADGGVDDGRVTQYRITVIKPDGETDRDQTSDDLEEQVEGLDAGRHVFRVAGVNSDGVGRESVSTTFNVELPDPPVTARNNRPVFGDATIDNIVATAGEPISGRFLPKATDADANDNLTYWIEDAAGITVTTIAGGLTFNDTTRALQGTPTTAMVETTYIYKVSDGSDEATIPFFVTVKAAVAGPPPTSRPTGMIPAKGFVVFVRDSDNPPHFGTSNPYVAQWPGTETMPNLHDLFMNQGGSLRLNSDKDLVFSEIMWAVDEGKVGQDSYDGKQWVEVHNRTDADVAISSISFTTKEGRPALDVGADRVSNVVGGGEKWIRTKGQNGNSGAADGSGQKEFISMYRTRYDREGWLGRDWGKSSQVYHPNHKGTPGTGEAPGPKTFAASGVALMTVFNEISNSSNPDHEWIELRIRSGDPHFQNWVVDMVTSASDRAATDNPKQERLFRMPKLNTGRYDDILLITKTDPARDDDHPLRGGYNVEVEPKDQDGEGRDKNIKYYVADEWDTDLPDNGNFVLILRNGNDKMNHEKIQDIAGYHPDLKVDRADFFSGLWPLIGYSAPNLSNNKIEAGQVAKRVYDDIPGTRTKDGNKIDKVAFRHDNNGWTGIGYKRNADAGAKNGGTPGYPNNALQSNETQAGADPVIISEIMYATGDRGNIPQWIELRNMSQTVGVNLDGWQITIVNHDQDSADATDAYPGDLVKSYNINGKIPPGQTFLITAHSGTDNTNLPSERIVALNNRRGELILSKYGFEVTLESKEKGGSRKLADQVGNLAAGADARRRGNPQSYATPDWMLPAGTNADGDRVSIVRVSGRMGILDGLEAYGWKSFDMSSHLNAPESTYYGNRNDLGSPGYTIDGVLPVSLSKFRPERLATGEVVVRWVTESETNNAGFNILRGEALDGEFTKLNEQLIAGKGTTSEKNTYDFVDTSAKPNVVYYYQIQDVSLDGDVVTLQITHLRGNISVVGKLTTTWGELKALQ